MISPPLPTGPPATATHSDTDGHDTPLTPGSVDWDAARVLVQTGALLVGFRETNTSPQSVTATHKETDGHDTPLTPGLLVIVEGRYVPVHAEAPPAGLVEART